MAKLVVISKGLPPASHELGEKWVTIGRAHDNSFQIVEASVSSRHCEVKLRGDELVVRDLQSTNGTFVAGKKVSEGVLKIGQTLRVGEVELGFEASTGPASGVPFTSKSLVTRAAQKSATPEEATTILKKAPAAETKPSAGDAKKVQVLFVDDSLAFLETFGELCAELSAKTWEIHSATTADKALELLKKTAVDLVVVDIGIPMVDGIQLLGIISRRYPGLKIAVMTGRPTEANRTACLASGAELFIEKPISPESIKVVFNMLDDLVSWTHREGFSGAMRQVGLQEVIQMQCVGRHSSVLEVRNAQTRGQIYIETGAIIHAAVGELTGEKAFDQLLSLRGGEFQIQPFKAPTQRTMQGNWEVLLMEAARASDEETDLLTRRAAQSAKDGHGLGDEVVVAATYDGGGGKWTPVDGGKK
jgi:CheY-like chemotaxis protein